MPPSRRHFLQTIGTAAAASFVPQAVQAKPDGGAGDYGDAWAVLVDTVVCIGCRKCEWACNREQQGRSEAAGAYEDRSVFEKNRRPDAEMFTVVNRFVDPTKPEKPFTIKMQCLHCNQPACVSACIVGALEKDSRGPVTYDAWKCIGCRYCMVACPFQIPAYEYHNALDPRVRKCTFCLERLEQGLKPACVAICPNEALTFGRRADLVELAKSRIRQSPEKYVNHVYGEHEVGGTSWLYLAGTDFARTGLPVLDERPIPEMTETIQHGVFKSWVPPLALYALLGLIMNALKREPKPPPDAEGRHDAP